MRFALGVLAVWSFAAWAGPEEDKLLDHLAKGYREGSYYSAGEMVARYLKRTRQPNTDGILRIVYPEKVNYLGRVGLVALMDRATPGAIDSVFGELPTLSLPVPYQEETRNEVHRWVLEGRIRNALWDLFPLKDKDLSPYWFAPWFLAVGVAGGVGGADGFYFPRPELSAIQSSAMGGALGLAFGFLGGGMAVLLAEGIFFRLPRHSDKLHWNWIRWKTAKRARHRFIQAVAHAEAAGVWVKSLETWDEYLPNNYFCKDLLQKWSDRALGK